MHRSFAWGVIAILAIILAPFAGVFGVPASTARADTAAPALAAAADDEVILLTSAGQIRVDAPLPPSSPAPQIWNSGSSQGWMMVAAGDFNGDGDAEIVATKSNTFQVFDPVVQSGRQEVTNGPISLGTQIYLVATGDFDGDTKDEIAIVFYRGGTNPYQLAVYDGGLNATAGDWRLSYPVPSGYAANWQDMSTGDINNDGADDVVMVRNADNRITVLNGRTWAELADQANYATAWYAVAAGNLTAAYAGDEIALERHGNDKNPRVNSLLALRVASGQLKDDIGGGAYYSPDFTSIATGDVNGDTVDETLLLRNPIYDGRVWLQMVNPAGATLFGFEQSTGDSPLFAIVRMGDVDGDGHAEVIVERTDRYRIYYQPEVDVSFTDYPGAFRTWSTSTVSNLPTIALANVDGVSGPVLSVTPTSLSFSLDCGDASPIKPLSITNSGTGSSFAWQAQAIEDSGSGWLLLDATSGTTPGTVNVSVRPGIAKGSYSGTVRITATDAGIQNTPVNVPVSYTSLCSGFSASPAKLTFNMTWGSTASQSVTVGGPGSSAWTASVAPVSPTTSCSWLTLSAMAGSTPSTVSVFVNAAVADLSDKQCTITFSAPGVTGSPQYVTVNLTVPDPGFVVTPTDFTIWQKTSAAPVLRYVTIFRPGGAVSWTASALPLSAAADLIEKLANGQATITAEGVTIDGSPVAAPDWLVFTPTAGTTNPTTPTMMQVSVKPGTSVGTYGAVITVAASGDPTLTKPVQLVYVTAIVADNFHFTFLPMVLNQAVQN
jgi:hypothetical protein